MRVEYSSHSFADNDVAWELPRKAVGEDQLGTHQAEKGSTHQVLPIMEPSTGQPICVVDPSMFDAEDVGSATKELCASRSWFLADAWFLIKVTYKVREEHNGAARCEYWYSRHYLVRTILVALRYNV